jgi:hypothetical protein
LKIDSGWYDRKLARQAPIRQMEKKPAPSRAMDNAVAIALFDSHSIPTIATRGHYREVSDDGD